MILRAGVLAHSAAPVIVAWERVSRASFQRVVAQRHIIFRHGGSITERQGYLNSLDEGGYVQRIGQIVPPDHRLRERIVASQAENS